MWNCGTAVPGHVRGSGRGRSLGSSHDCLRPVCAARERPSRLPGDALSGRDNALNALRLLLAVVVLVWHSFVVLGRDADGALASMGATWAVNGFFAVSGYLICGSRLRLR